MKRFTPHIYNISPTALYESLQIVIGPRSSNGTFSTVNCLTEGNKKANSVWIRETDSPPQSVPQSSRVTQKALNSLTFTSSQSASAFLRNNTEKSTVSLHTTQTLTQKLEAISQLPINSFVTKLTGANVQSVPTVQSVQTVQSTPLSSPLVQIQTLPIIPTQILTQQSSGADSGTNGHLTRSNSLSANPSIINLIAPSPAVSVSYINTVSNPQTNTGLNHMSVNNKSLISGHFGNVMISKPNSDLTHLLGATVLTFDSQNRPLLSVYSPSIAAAEERSTTMNNTNNSKNQKSDLHSTTVTSCSEQSDVCTPMDTSFYSPNNITKSAKPPTKSTKGLNMSDEYLWPLNGQNFEESSNHSANSLLDFTSNCSQSKSQLIYLYTIC